MIPGNANPLLLATAAEAAAGAVTTKSLRFHRTGPLSGTQAGHLKGFTPSSAGNRKKYTFAAWVKRSRFGDTYLLFSAGTGAFGVDHIKFSYEKLELLSYDSSLQWKYITTAVFRDPSAWYHITCAVDTTLSTAADRVKIYVNGTRIEDFDTETAPSQNYEGFYNSTVEHAVGYDVGNVGYTFDGYMADVFFIDGSALSPVNNFIELDSNGVYQKKDYSGTFGSNGFHLLDFANESTVGHDSSGNENDFTANNISTTAGAGNDVLFDVPTNGTQSDTGAGGEVSGCYATLNPLEKGSAVTLSNGNLNYSVGASSQRVHGTIGVSSGKWYWEETKTSGTYGAAGISKNVAPTTFTGNDAHSWSYNKNGNKYHSGTGASYGATWDSGDIIGVAFDADNGSITFYKNGASQGVAYSNIPVGDTYFPACGDNATVGHVNFGARSFTYSAPSGYKALCTTNLPTPTIADGSDYFDTKLYDGNGSTNAITGFKFSPDFVWLKRRSGAKDHSLFDTVRGVYLQLFTNNSDAEASKDTSLTSFDSNGFTLGSSNRQNENGYTNVAWAWDAGSSSAASNTDGGITSSVKVNSTAGFSIGTYTGTASINTVGTGLSDTKVVILKNRDSSSNWVFYHTIVDGSYDFMYLNLTNANSSSGLSHTMSNTFKVGTNTDTNASGDDYLFYAFTPVAGYSAFGSYTGNGNADGTFIALSFRPAFLLIKRTDAVANWYLLDTARDPQNVANSLLRPNISDAEITAVPIDILSNGFKLRDTDFGSNASGGTYMYYAVAENPFQANGGLAR